MKERKALDLVMRYSHHTREIKAMTAQIGQHLDQCKGVNGDRLNVDHKGWPTYRPELDEKGRDKGLHLWGWYQPDISDDGTMNPTQVWQEVGVIEAEECPHCYAAHLAILARKEHRKKLGAVKAAMTRGGSA